MQRLFRQAIQNEMAAERFKENSILFDEITAGLHWREFAYPHQIEGGKYLAANGRVILGDKMGLGKSLTSLIACDMLKSQRVLIVVPDDVVSNFAHEVYKWAPHRQVISLGKMSKAERAAGLTLLGMLDSFVVILNYSIWRKDNSLLDALIDIKFDTMIIDEAHNVKETTTNAHRGVYKIAMAENSCPECGGNIQQVKIDNGYYNSATQTTACVNETTCGWSQERDNERGVKRDFGYLRSVKNLFPMTGTPILNKPTDLFALLSLIDPENFRDKYIFERDYCAKDYWTKKIKFREGGMDSLVKRLSGKWLARDRKSAGVVLPKQDIVYHTLELSEDLYPKQLKVIKQLTKYATIMFSQEKKMTNIAAIALITRKRQANVWPGGITQRDENGDIVFTVADEVNESIKLDWCCDKNGEGNIPDITAGGNMALGDRVIVFSQFKDPLRELENRLNNAGISVVRFDGDTTQSVRDAVKIDFDRSRCNAEGYEKKWQVVLCNYKTGGVGLNFTDATQMIILDSEWNGGKEDQALGRVDRIGQTEESIVHVLEIDQTIDTWMRALITSKRDMVNGFESTVDVAQLLFEAMNNGEVL
jgi:SNF2 family DNA or RNA helicase